MVLIVFAALGALLARGEAASVPAISLKGSLPPAPYDFAAARKQWAYHAPGDVSIPTVSQAQWCKSPIDYFIRSKLEQRGLRPAPPAPKAVLIRRAYFDLIGLPPTPAEVDAFVLDNSPDAFAKVVDHLLASPAYGQRWARHWLDVVRYTDAFDSRSVKGDVVSDGDVSKAWRYRDWVVNAFNRDMPYDQFVVNQIAGDLLPPKSGDFNADGLIATTMYVIGNWGPGDADKEKMLTDIVDDQIDVTGRAFLGLTLACARCHDHKFDPIPTADYYGLAGIFFSSHIIPDPGIKTAGSPVSMLPLVSKAELERRAEHDRRIASLRTQVDRILDEQYTHRAMAMLPLTDQYLAAVREIEKGGAAPSSASEERSLDPVTLARWADYVDRQLHPARQRRLLTTARHRVAGIEGLEAWTGPADMPPSATANTTDHAVAFSTIKLPPRSISVHPGPRSGVAVGWRSPIAGTVEVSGQVADADPNCGNGIDWSIDRVPARGIERIASGSFDNGKKQSFARGSGGAGLREIKVQPGDYIQLCVYPKGDYSCDTTAVKLQVAEREGDHRTWDLVEDVLADVLGSGPWPDRFGNKDVWEFYEVPDESAAGIGGSAVDPLLSQWLSHVDVPDDAEVAKSEVALRDALVALDAKAEALRNAGKDIKSLNGPGAQLYRELTAPRGDFWAPARQVEAGIGDEAKHELDQTRAELSKLQKQTFPAVPTAHGVQEGGTPHSVYEGIHDAHIEIRGRYDRLGDLVPRHFPRLLAGDDQPPITSGSGRRQLARSIASPSNPLTARVMVNRIWQHHFGQGIVRTPNNFGKLGTPPTHPELLDYLARAFVRQGWSIKAMHRMIMLSATYQQSSVPDQATQHADPDNLLVGRMTRQRLDAESIRDSVSLHGLETRATPGSVELEGDAMPVSLGAKPEHDFNDPLGLLSDCHRRIERFLGILLRVAEQHNESGDSPTLDREHREALEAALQYFRVALPRHTLDEEESLFPRLRASSSAEAQSALQTLSELEADHAAADARHLRVDELGKQWLARGRLEPDQLAEIRTLLTELRDVYTRHIRVEDTLLFPAARHVLDPAQVHQIGKEMADRRGLGPYATSAMSGSAGL